MKNIVTIFSLTLLAGCLSSAPKAPVSWCVDADTDLAVSSVMVAAPYDGQPLVVLRGDGSMAFDPCNSFAARPSALLRAAVRIEPHAGDLLVRRLALDCTKDGKREALVQLSLYRTGEPILRSKASVDAAEGNYTAAFTDAFVKAVDGLREQLKR